MNGIVRFVGFKPEEDFRIYVNSFLKQIIDWNIPASSVQLSIEKKNDGFEAKCTLKALEEELSVSALNSVAKTSVDEVDRLVRRKLASQTENSKFADLHIYGLSQS